MNLTYTFVILGILIPIFILCGRASRKLSRPTVVILTLAITAMTLVFDNMLVALKIVAYDTHKILGLVVPIAPMEDFGYTAAGLILIPVLWNFFGRGRSSDE